MVQYATFAQAVILAVVLRSVLMIRSRGSIQLHIAAIFVATTATAAWQ